MRKIKEEIERNNQNILKRKQIEKDALQVILLENEKKKQKEKEEVELERLEDIKVTKNNIQRIDKQDQERNNLFINKMRKPNPVTHDLIQNVLKEMELKKKFDEEKILQYEAERDKK